MLAIWCAALTQPQLVEAAKPLKNSKDETTKYSTEPFDTELQTLSEVHWNHHDPALIYAALRQAPVKDQYETTEAFEKRLASWKSKPIVGSLTPNSMIALSSVWMPDKAKTYNADTEQMSFPFPYGHDLRDARGYPFLPFKSEEKHLPPGRGQTAMGIKFTWTRDYTLAVGTRLNGLNNATIQFSIPPQEARTLVPVLLFIGKIDPIRIDEERNTHEPTLSEPWETLHWTMGWTLDVKQVWVVGRGRAILAKLCRSRLGFEPCPQPKEQSAPAAQTKLGSDSPVPQ